jgi:tRNA-2-methylthio-N6-dimethylallyladenosine synthase
MGSEKDHTQPKVFIETYGCQMNVLDSELVQGQLEALGYGKAETPLEAQVVLLNTCSVRELSEQKVWSQLGRLGLVKKAEQKELIIGVLGCMAEREGSSILKRMPHVDVVCGPSNLDRLPMMVENARLHGVQAQMALSGHTSRRSATLERAQDGVETMDLSRAFSPEASRFQAYVRITRGCNKFCSFCVVPYTRGPEVHRHPDHIVEEIRKLVEQGAREVTLIGQTVNHYVYKDGGRTTSFADLLWLVHESVPELPRLRFLTSYPRDFGDDALDVMAAASRICKYLHVPAQSGSNAMLRAMNRGYTVEEYESLLERARAKMPHVRLAGDMIAGFPGETDADHEASLALLKRAQYKSCFVFKYSPREGTVASRRFEDNVPEDVKKQRNYELLEVQSDISLERHRALIGEVLPVLVEGEGKRGGHRGRLVGRTEGDEIVAFEGPSSWVGSIVDVRVLDATPLTLLAVPHQAATRDTLRAEVSAPL